MTACACVYAYLCLCAYVHVRVRVNVRVYVPVPATLLLVIPLSLEIIPFREFKYFNPDYAVTSSILQCLHWAFLQLLGDAAVALIHVCCKSETFRILSNVDS